ncbi:hypothetical protein PFISCL1PPCAC_24734, partial [Pristionchus fissidentatus]
IWWISSSSWTLSITSVSSPSGSASLASSSSFPSLASSGVVSPKTTIPPYSQSGEWALNLGGILPITLPPSDLLSIQLSIFSPSQFN